MFKLLGGGAVDEPLPPPPPPHATSVARTNRIETPANPSLLFTIFSSRPTSLNVLLATNIDAAAVKMFVY